MGLWDRDWYNGRDKKLSEAEKQRRLENARRVFEKMQSSEAAGESADKDDNRIDRIRFRRSEEEKEAHLKRVRKQLEKSMRGTKWRFLKVTLPKMEPKEKPDTFWRDAVLVTVIGLLLGAGITIKLLIR